MIGIDVIDRSYPHNFNRHPLHHYRLKLLNTTEHELYTGEDAIAVAWAVKESVYKCYCNGGGEPFYNPKNIHILTINATSGQFTAQVNDHIYSGMFLLSAETILSIATPLDGKEKKTVYGLFDCDMPFDEPAFFFGRDVPVQWKTGVRGVPNEMVTGDTSYFYSRSHHGKWYASALLKAHG